MVVVRIPGIDAYRARKANDRNYAVLTVREGSIVASTTKLHGDTQFQRALEHVRHLFALVRVLWHNRAALQVNLSHGLPFAGHEFPGNHLGDFFERDFVPAVETIRKRHGWDRTAPIIAFGTDV